MEQHDLVPGGGTGGARGGVEGVIDGLAGQGYAVMPGYFSPTLMRALLREARLREKRGEFRPAAVGRHNGQLRNRLVRTDHTCWLEGQSLAQCRLLEELETLRLGINRSLFLGLFDLESHFAVYPPGAFYRRHLDAFKGNNPRVVSVVVYMNPVWSAEDGGCLRLWRAPDARRAIMDVPPRSGTLVCFLSEQIPHEVLPAINPRFSIAGWFRRQAGDIPGCIAPL